ncbi:ISKra4 family transposase (plasmid) [Nostoc sp. UHCC 0926]|uniref:ISKra4 family transposase n=1 Tax=Nostoc sp. UHCC 0926 TaxID=3025190 RepID=UPI00236169D6|nr:ISKra4 family transposase [Nostoc sp. UHCC 0926]WDD36236.1 ISKra4 family transposase [Nostoc sp. UHCC 0926]
MTPEQKQALQEHIQAIAKILYEDTSKEKLTNLAGIEEAVRSQMQKHVMPEVGGFFIETVTGTTAGYQRQLKSILGELPITSKQAIELEVAPSTQLSPYLETCCLRVSANVSYEDAASDIKYFTGVQVSHSSQQRLVHRQNFDLPMQEDTVEELSVDGGNIRVRTPKGQICAWLGYKVISLHHLGMLGTSFRNNQIVIDWVNAQSLASTVTCIGDGHDGIWNIVDQLASDVQRREVLDWFHLIENLHKVGGSQKRLKQAQALLWKGQVEATKALFADCKSKQVQNFCGYLDKHRDAFGRLRLRIINYEYHQAEQICSIGSGSVESAVKQIDRRTKISGAQWKRENVPQVLAHRSAYLNGLLSV